MLLREISVRNFKAFNGLHRLIISEVSQDRNIYLVGAMNGAGKSSLVQAMLVGLFGSGAAGMPGVFRGGRDHRRRYEAWVGEAHNSAARAANEDSMTLRTVLDVGGTLLDATRTYWFKADGSYEDEQFRLTLSGRRGEAETLQGDEAAEVLVGYLPRHLAELTFFDGEHIGALDRPETGPWLIEALDRLLDLEPIKRAQNDLARMARDKRALLADPTQVRAYSSLQDKLDRAQSSLAESDATLVGVRNQMLDARAELTRLDEQISSKLTHGTAISVAQVEAEAAALATRRKALQERLGRNLGEWLFFDLVPELLADTTEEARQTLAGRERTERGRERATAAAHYANTLAQDPEILSLLTDDSARKLWRTRLDQLLPAIPNLDQSDKLSWAATFSDDELADIQAAGSVHNQRDRTDVREIAGDYLAVETRIDEIARLHMDLDASVGLDKVLERRDELQQQTVEWQRQISELESANSESRQSVAAYRSGLSRLDATLNDSAEASTWLDASEALVGALDVYVQEQRAKAIGQLSDGVLRRLRPLLRKQRLVTSVSIDPTSHQIILRDASGSPVRLPSAGEQQLAALAFAAAMLDLAADPLPMIIDTPLARLDSQHRLNLVADLLPNLGRQVLVLSTDEEIDADLLRALEQSVAEKYLIAHNDDTGGSQIIAHRYLDLESAIQEVREDVS